MYRLGKCLNLHQREVLAKSFILANLNYCPMVWHFCSSVKNTAKIEIIYKRALKFMMNDFTSDYEISGQSIYTEIYKTADVLSASYLKELSIPRNSAYTSRGSQNPSMPRVNKTSYGLKSIRYQGPKLI